MNLFCTSRSIGGFFDRGDNALVRAATADVPVHEPDDLSLRWIFMFSQQSHAGHDHAGGAIAALQRVVVEKGLLQRMQSAIVFEALDGEHLAPSNASHCNLARAGGSAVKQNGAGATASFPTSIFRPREIKVIAQNAQQGPFTLRVNGGAFAVHI